MGNILHYLFVIIVNIIGWGVLVFGVAGFIAVFRALITGKGNNKGNTPGLPWL